LLFKKPKPQPRPVCLLLLTLLTILLLPLPACSQAPNSSTEPAKAAIVDQLSSLQPNEAFISEVTQQLQDYGFEEVNIYRGNNVTVELYKKLPSCGYKLIIFRAHSGLLGSEGQTIPRTCLFTNEPYSEREHVAEQLSDQLAMARIDEHHPWVFGIGDEFVTQSMEGQFDNTVIIMMGCATLSLDDLAQAFIGKGASTYLGWDASVDLDYVDGATAYLTEQLCIKKVTVGEAVTNTMNVIGPDPKYHAELNYFSLQNGDKALKELIGG
jgi:hypothetical protein